MWLLNEGNLVAQAINRNRYKKNLQQFVYLTVHGGRIYVGENWVSAK
jgi:hypothetical protein